ncbi:prolipoprotein diacylglyceryl transferase [Uliginosibacterium sp. H3]|uniref:Phosphatidylglycerol--prolipoprotein diacylglyceryl transferase n=1 Tax=Uliginosibacterium silvisoli TaxID=3114758 RepID=A0ABU6K168_9RHOO|nr:prolipoprotein diacylglyceryl transferase [Uliginosibacterium sp. H3]
MLVHPQFDPIAVSLGPLHVRWYGLMYLIAFLLFVWLGKYRARKNLLTGWIPNDVDDLLFYGALGVVLGGRLGYVVFYKLSYYLAHPIEIAYIWEGGMSFHGGFIGVLVALWLFGRKTKRGFWQIADFVAPLVPTGLAAGRMGNFINGELWGRVTAPDAPWAMIFPQARAEDVAQAAGNPALTQLLNLYGGLPRHPSQLYQFALEGLALFLILWLYTRKPRPLMAPSALFLMGYGTFRFIAEYAREPDSFLGLLTFNLSMGQLLSLPMIVIGLALWIRAHKRASS